MQYEDISPNVEYIPNNVLNKGKFLGFDWIRWVEASVLILSFSAMIMSTNLLPKIKLIICSVIGVSLLVLCLHGIKNRSISEFFIDASRDRKIRKKYSLASIDINRKGIIRKQYGEFGNKSYLELLIDKIKLFFKTMDEKYDPKEQ